MAAWRIGPCRQYRGCARHQDDCEGSSGWLQARDVIGHGDMCDPVALQQQHGVALLLAENRHQNIVHPDFVLAAGLYVEHSALQHALEVELRLHRVLLAGYRNPPQSVGRNVLPEVRAELIEVRAAFFEPLAHPLGVKNREQQVLDRQKFMVCAAGVTEGLIEARLQLA
jgi:hypothetical protein